MTMKSEKIDIKSFKKQFDDNNMKYSDFRDLMEKQGIQTRIVCYNGKPQAYTMDYRPNRLNIKVINAVEKKETIDLDEEERKYHGSKTYEYVTFELGPDTIVEKIVSAG